MKRIPPLNLGAPAPKQNATVKQNATQKQTVTVKQNATQKQTVTKPKTAMNILKGTRRRKNRRNRTQRA